MSDIKTLFFDFVTWCEAHPEASTILATLFVAVVGWFTGAIGWIVSKFSPSETSAGASAEVNGANSGANVGHAGTVNNTSNDPELIKHFVDIQNDQIVRLQDELKGANSDKDSLHREIAELQQRIANPEDYIEAALKTSDQTIERLTRLSNEVDADKLQQAKDAAKRLDFSDAEKIFNDIKNRNELAVQQTASADMGLGDIAEQQVRWHDAYAHYKRAYVLTGDIDALEGYARMAWRLGKYQESLELSEVQLALVINTFGEECEQVAEVLNNLAVLHQVLGQFDKAEPLYHQAMEITRKTIGEDHPVFATWLNNLGVLHYHQERFSEAAPLLRQAMAIREAKLPEGHPDTENTRQSLEDLYAVHPELRD